MAYDPFARGPHAVGVRTSELNDRARKRTFPLEIWYPAQTLHAGHDLADPTRDRYSVLPGFPAVTQDAVRDAEPAVGSFPLVAFSHGFGGHRRQSTFLCTHLASHGYVVASPDHVGNTAVDTMQTLMEVQAGKPIPEPEAMVQEFVVKRPADITFLLDRLLDGSAGGLADRIDASRVGMTGHSFGGWTTLMAVARDPRCAASRPGGRPHRHRSGPPARHRRLCVGPQRADALSGRRAGHPAPPRRHARARRPHTRSPAPRSAEER